MSHEKKTFITTTDKQTAEKLMSEGFELVSQSGNVYTFLNQPPKNFIFDDADKKRVVYTNTLNM